jgi:hypothetical protein
MDIEYDVNLDDAVEFNHYVSNHNPKSKNRRKIVRAIYIFDIVVFAFIGLVSLLGNQIITGVIFSLLAVGIGTYYWYRFSRVRIKQAVVKQYVKIPNEEICRHKLSISDSGLHDITDYEESTTHWSAFNEILQTNKYLYFFMKPGKAYIVPKRAFADDMAFNRFVETARNYHSKAVK